MLLRLVSRLARALAILFAVIIINFAIVRLAPGDPATVLAGAAGASDETILAELRSEFGLDKPISVQLGIYLRDIADLDLGQSYRQRRPVTEIILERLPATLLLTGTAFVLSVLFGVVLGVLAAHRVGTLSDRIISTLALLVFATPIYFVGLTAILLFSVQFNLLPAYGMESLGRNLQGLARVGDIALHLAMPAITLALFYMAMYLRLMRASMIEVQNEDFIKTARAKGAGPRRILFRHALRNAVLPVVTVAGMQAGNLVGGAVLIETVFAWPGLGRLALDAVFQRDYNVLLGIFLVTAALGLLFNIITDILYTVIDPRMGRA